MRRIWSCLLIAAMALPFALTGLVLTRFHLERERIIREACVQRFLPVEQNCCRGTCQLEKRLQEHGLGERQAPTPRIELRVEQAIVHALRAWVIVPEVYARGFAPERGDHLAAGHPSPIEPVPWG